MQVLKAASACEATLHIYLGTEFARQNCFEDITNSMLLDLPVPLQRNSLIIATFHTNMYNIMFVYLKYYWSLELSIC